jgi:hypothetical protein
MCMEGMGEGFQPLLKSYPFVLQPKIQLTPFLNSQTALESKCIPGLTTTKPTIQLNHAATFIDNTKSLLIDRLVHNSCQQDISSGHATFATIA